MPSIDEAYVDARLERGAPVVGRPALRSTGYSNEALSRHDRPTLEELGPAERGGRNQMTQHPPLYYSLLGGVSTVITSFLPGDDVWSLDRLVYLLRLLNVALIAPLPALAYVAGRRLGTSVHGAVAAGLVVISVPQLAHLDPP